MFKRKGLSYGCDRWRFCLESARNSRFQVFMDLSQVPRPQLAAP